MPLNSSHSCLDTYRPAPSGSLTMAGSDPSGHLTQAQHVPQTCSLQQRRAHLHSSRILLLPCFGALVVCHRHGHRLALVQELLKLALLHCKVVRRYVPSASTPHVLSPRDHHLYLEMQVRDRCVEGCCHKMARNVRPPSKATHGVAV